MFSLARARTLNTPTHARTHTPTHSHTYTHTQTCNARRCDCAATYIIDTILGKPMETFDEEQQCKESDKTWTKVVAEHCKRQTCLRDGIPRTLYQVLKQIIDE